VATTIAIMVILITESLAFFKVSLVDFLTDTQWSPLFADAHYGILPVSGTLVTTAVALLVATPGYDRGNLPDEFAAPALQWSNPA